MITSELKDRILKSFVEKGIVFATDTNVNNADYDIDSATYCAILDSFERKGYLSQQKNCDGLFLININSEAHDLIRMGGFVAQEELLKANIQKLGLEIDLLCKELSPKLLEKAHRISAIGSAILSTLKLITTSDLD